MSYYQCLAHRFAKVDFNEFFKDDAACKHERPCTIFSLPFGGDNQFPICNNQNDSSCYEQVVAYLEKDQERHCLKSCRVEEFEVVREPDLFCRRNGIQKCHGSYLRTALNNTFDLTGSDPFYTIALGYEFGLLSKHTWQERYAHYFKTVRREYLLNNLISLIGTVGGTLGMFVGFSFIGTSDWLTGKHNGKIILANIKSSYEKCRKNIRKKNSVIDPDKISESQG